MTQEQEICDVCPLHVHALRGRPSRRVELGRRLVLALGALWLLFWIALMGVVAWLAITVIRRQGGSGGAARAKDILAERFARGELSAEEYRQRLEQLD
jgi:uncharacterized membrane protein